MSTTHRASLVLSFIAFALFVTNVFMELAGFGALNLRGPAGAGILTGFLAAGLLIQVAKFIEGHRSRIDLIATGIMLPAHVLAELTIWVRTQIMHVGLPPELPFYLIGLYWCIGIADVLARYLGRELRVFDSSYVPLEQENAMLKQRLALVEQSQALQEQMFEERCTICGEAFEHHTKSAAKRALRAHVGRKHSNGYNKQSIPELEERGR